jgi:hypothetical protein
MMFALAHAQSPVVMGPYEWGFVALSSVIIFSILGKRLWLDFKDAS